MSEETGTFREMLRQHQKLPREECVDILRSGKTAILAVAGDGGYPYAVPVNYVYEDGKIFFHCAKTGHKLDAIRRCDKVSLCVIARDDVVPEELTTYFQSVIVFGRARILETDAEVYRAVKALALKYSDDLTAVEQEIRREWPALACVEITVEHVTGKEARELARRRTR